MNRFEPRCPLNQVAVAVTPFIRPIYQIDKQINSALFPTTLFVLKVALHLPRSFAANGTWLWRQITIHRRIMSEEEKWGRISTRARVLTNGLEINAH